MIKFPRWPKFRGFRDLGMIERMMMRKYFSYLAVILLLLFFGAAIITNMFNGGQKTNAAIMTLADGRTISQTDTTDYSNSDIIIPSGVTAYIDGEHTFRSVTVKSGGTLTSHDYNRYGVYPQNDRSQDFGNILDTDNWKYVFVMRGFINTGNVHNRVFTVDHGGNGYDSSASVRFNPDDAASIDFYPAVASQPTGQESYYGESWWSGTPAGSAYSNITFDGVWASWNSGLTLYRDNTSSAAKPLIPFELKYYNQAGENRFGISTCTGSTTSLGAECDIIQNYSYLDTISLETAFQAAPARPEMKTFVSWQSGSRTVTGELNAADPANSNLPKWRKASSFNTVLNNYKNGLGWNPNHFYKASAYDFRNDRRADARISETGEIIYYRSSVEVKQRENSYELASVGQVRPKSHFYPDDDRTSPLAMRWDVNRTLLENVYPILSESLIASLPKKLSTVINVPNGSFTVESGGKVNFNGKGYSPGGGLVGGSGLGGGRRILSAGGAFVYTGASHAGIGGSYPAPEDNRYDNSEQVDPVYPGSGGYRSYSDQSYVGFGGGIIKIIANKIVLQADSMVMANGVGYQPDNPPSGSSGGAIVLSDNSVDSRYDGLISAQGALCSDNTSTNCSMGGGGGGYISISTKVNTVPLLARKVSDASKRLWLFYDGAKALNPSIDDFVANGNFLRNTITAAGGRNQYSTESNWGQYGIVKISSDNASGFSIRKELFPVTRNGVAASFNPYALIAGDRIRVSLRVENLSSGVVITDTPLKQKGIADANHPWLCSPVTSPDSSGGNPLDVPATMDDGLVSWNLTGRTIPADGINTFYYECLVKRLP